MIAQAITACKHSGAAVASFLAKLARRSIGGLLAGPRPWSRGVTAAPTQMPSGMLPHHAAKVFEESGISPEVAAARGYETVYSQAQLKRLGFGDGQLITPTLLHPAWGVTGDTPILYQHRPDRPRVRKGKAKAIKYETPTGGRLVSTCRHAFVRSSPTRQSTLWITEGIRKADAAASRGLACIDLIGVWGWRGSNQWGGKAALPDWEYIALNGRQCYICFDSDVMLKQEVHMAMVRLGAFLEQRGAESPTCTCRAARTGKDGA